MIDRLAAGYRQQSLRLLVLGAALGAAAAARADTFSTYAPQPADNLPLPDVASGIQGGSLMSSLPDGRLLVVTTSLAPDFTTAGAELWIQTSLNSKSFQYLGDLPNLPRPKPTDPPYWYNPGGFLTVSQNPLGDGTLRVAVGDSAFAVGIFTLDPLAPAVPASIAWYGADGNYFDGDFVASAAWQNNSTLAVGLGDYSGNSQVDLFNVVSPATTTILDAPGATGGIAFDAAGNLYYGIGYGSGPGYAVGDISEFPAGSFPTTFSSGTHVATQLSAAWLQFDSEGNLLVGGGDTFGDSGQYGDFAILDGSGLDRPPRIFDPDQGSDFNAYNVLYDQATGQIFAWDNFGSDPLQVWAFADDVAAAVPEPSAIVLAATAAIAAGALALRRRHKKAATIGRGIGALAKPGPHGDNVGNELR